jgi:hypothetical protein
VADNSVHFSSSLNRSTGHKLNGVFYLPGEMLNSAAESGLELFYMVFPVVQWLKSLQITFFSFFNACILWYYLLKPLASLSCSLNAVIPCLKMRTPTHFIIPIAVLDNVPPDAGLQKKNTFSTLNVGLAGTVNQTQATCVASSVARRSATHNAFFFYLYKCLNGLQRLCDITTGHVHMTCLWYACGACGVPVVPVVCLSCLWFHWFLPPPGCFAFLPDSYFHVTSRRACLAPPLHLKLIC